MYNYIHYHYYTYIYNIFIDILRWCLDIHPFLVPKAHARSLTPPLPPPGHSSLDDSSPSIVISKKHLKKHQAKNGVYVYIYIWKSTIYIHLCLFFINGEKDVLKIMEYFQSKIPNHQISMPGNLGWCPSFPTNPPSHHSACGEAGASTVSCIIEKPHCGWESMGLS